jgi:hypothetical protein
MQSPSAKAFMEFVDEWFYRHLSQDPHFAYMGIAWNGSLVAGHPSETLRAYRKGVFSTALALYLTLLSEVIVESKLPTEARRIRQVWEELLQIEPVAQLWHARHKELITAISGAS